MTNCQTLFKAKQVVYNRRIRVCTLCNTLHHKANADITWSLVKHMDARFHSALKHDSITLALMPTTYCPENLVREIFTLQTRK